VLSYVTALIVSSPQQEGKVRSVPFEVSPGNEAMGEPLILEIGVGGIRHSEVGNGTRARGRLGVFSPIGGTAQKRGLHAIRVARDLGLERFDEIPPRVPLLVLFVHFLHVQYETYRFAHHESRQEDQEAKDIASPRHTASRRFVALSVLLCRRKGRALPRAISRWLRYCDLASGKQGVTERHLP
jgi:hypothetical protein